MITTDGTEIDFGEMKFGKSYTKDYKIVNNDYNPLKVTKLGKSCTCTRVWMDSDVIQPKQKGVIHVEVTPGSTGVFLRSFYFDADRIDKTTTVKLKGNAV